MLDTSKVLLATGVFCSVYMGLLYQFNPTFELFITYLHDSPSLNVVSSTLNFSVYADFLHFVVEC